MPINFLALDYIALIKEKDKKLATVDQQGSSNFLSTDKNEFLKTNDTLTSPKRNNDTSNNCSITKAYTEFLSAKSLLKTKTNISINPYEKSDFVTRKEIHDNKFSKNFNKRLAANKIERISTKPQIISISENLRVHNQVALDLQSDFHVTSSILEKNQEKSESEKIILEKNKVENEFSDDNFDEDEFNEWLNDPIKSKTTQEKISEPSSDEESFNDFISGNYIPPNSNLNNHLKNTLITSPSYSPLDTPNSSICQYSQIIQLDKNLELKYETGIDSIQSKTVNLDLKNFKNLKLNDNKIEIVLNSDSDSPSYEMDIDEIVQDFFDKHKIKENDEDQIMHEDLNINHDQFSEDYLYRFSESLETMKDMLDTLDKSLELNQTNDQVLNEIKIFKTKKELKPEQIIKDFARLPKVHKEENKLNSVDVTIQPFQFKKFNFSDSKSSITITKIKKPELVKKASIKEINQTNRNEIKSLPILNSEIESEIWSKIENNFVKYIKLCHQNLEINYTLEELNLELVHFLLEEHLRKKTNRKLSKFNGISKISWLTLIECCFSGLDLIFNCCLLTGVNYLKSMLVKFEWNPEIKDSIEFILIEIEKIISTSNDDRYFNIYVESECLNIKSPKILNLCKYINEAHLQNSNYKFLVILPRDSPSLLTSLQHDIQSMTSLRTTTYVLKSNIHSNQFEFFKSISTYDVLIINNNVQLYDKILDFTHIIAYEPLKAYNDSVQKEINKLYDECSKKSIKLVNFDEYKIEFEPRKILDKQLQENAEDLNEKMKILIVSSKAANDPFLVDILEYEMGLKLYVRDYGSICNENNLDTNYICDADILIDEQTGVIFQDGDLFQNFFEDEFNFLIKKLLSFKFSLRNLFLVFLSHNLKTNHQNYAKIFKFFKDHNQKSQYFKLQIFLAKGYENLKIFMEKILSVDCEQNSNKFNFCENPSLDEIFLLSLGCFNSYNAQVMLFDNNLTDLITMNIDDFIHKFNFIDRSTAQLFFNLIDFV
ncbi:unnamed protein product [Brachionus calyciflorus]|uniref:Uncharacterized protein n=1 Tax=Brachionus calyciflorus TaxID=104777 RepID=A0A813VUN5_9BILA|nr:unnamed protein product [Brachionus calyciflorus]